MAKLLAMPEQAIIDGLRGVIDFYVNYQSCDREVAGAGIPCARRWPVMRIKERAPSVQAGWPAFSAAAVLWSELSPEIRDSYKAMATGSGLSGRDMFSRSYLSGLYRYPTGP
ncbi:hypothetical protein ES703_116387 [subsurface metagenome]